MIHPTAVVHPAAEVDGSARIGPYAVVDEGVVVGPDCVVGPHVHLTGDTTIGSGNRFHAGAVIGDAPQDLKYEGRPTRTRIGDDNVFREHVTVNRSTTEDEETVIGSSNFLMASSHVGHNCRVGDHVIMANGAMLGGYASVADRVFISGNCLVHQFVRIGTLALMQGGSAVSKDLPPYTVARGSNGMCGLNVVGLRRAGVPAEQRTELKALYHHLFRGKKLLQEALETARADFSSACARTFLDFVAEARRGVCADTGTRR